MKPDGKLERDCTISVGAKFLVCARTVEKEFGINSWSQQMTMGLEAKWTAEFLVMWKKEEVH